MLNLPGANHVQINVTEAIEQVASILHPRTLVRMLPHRPVMALALVASLRNHTRGKLHHISNRIPIQDFDDNVNVIAGH